VHVNVRNVGVGRVGVCMLWGALQQNKSAGMYANVTLDGLGFFFVR
jgi:hypothetical protein